MPKVNPTKTSGPISKRNPSKRFGKSSGAVDRILSLDKVEHDGIKACFYGHSGTGKTRLIGSFAQAGRLLHLICSSNGTNECRSIKGTKGVDVVEIQEPDDLGELVEMAAQSGKYTTVALDHVTSFSELVLARILKVETLPPQSSWGMAEHKEYQEMGLKVKLYLKDLIALPCNVIMTGQERIFKETKDSDDEAIMPYVSISTTPTVAGWIAPAVDFMGRTFKRTKVIIEDKKMGDTIVTKKTVTKEKEYGLLVGPSTVYVTKFRCPPGTVLPDVVVNPTYENLEFLVDEE